MGPMAFDIARSIEGYIRIGFRIWMIGRMERRMLSGRQVGLV